MDRNGAREWARATLRSLTLEQKIGQLICLPDAPGEAVDGDLSAWAQRQIAAGRVGSLYLLGRQLVSPAQTAELCSRMQALAPLPLLVATDVEAGVGHVMRQGATGFPMQIGLGAARSPELVARLGELAAREARAVGIHWNFGPCVDVNVNPRNPIIATRSFGESVELV